MLIVLVHKIDAVRAGGREDVARTKTGACVRPTGVSFPMDTSFCPRDFLADLIPTVHGSGCSQDRDVVTSQVLFTRRNTSVPGARLYRRLVAIHHQIVGWRSPTDFREAGDRHGHSTAKEIGATTPYSFNNVADIRSR